MNILLHKKHQPIPRFQFSLLVRNEYVRLKLRFPQFHNICSKYTPSSSACSFLQPPLTLSQSDRNVLHSTPILGHYQPIFLVSCDTQSSIPIQNNIQNHGSVYCSLHACKQQTERQRFWTEWSSHLSYKHVIKYTELQFWLLFHMGVKLFLPCLRKNISWWCPRTGC